LSASVSPPRQRAYILVPHDQTPRISQIRRRPPVGYERGDVQITRFGATLGVHLGDQVAGRNGGYACGLPSDSTTYRNRYPYVPTPQDSTMLSLAVIRYPASRQKRVLAPIAVLHKIYDAVTFLPGR
jgi:hypothetical protein